MGHFLGGKNLKTYQLRQDNTGCAIEFACLTLKKRKKERKIVNDPTTALRPRTAPSSGNAGSRLYIPPVQSTHGDKEKPGTFV